MTLFEAMLSAVSVAACGIGLLYVSHIVQTSGRDRPHDPKRVQQLLARWQLSRAGPEATSLKAVDGR